MAAVNGFAPVSQLEDRRQPTTTLEGWRRFVDADPPEFTLLSDENWVALSAEQRTDYNEAPGGPSQRIGGGDHLGDATDHQ